MDIQNVPIDSIKPYAKNPRKNDAAVDRVAASIREFGFKQPIVADEDGVIIVGHTRHKAAKKLGLQKVPVLYARDLSPEQAKAYRLADNRTAEFSEWDMELLAGELVGLEEFDMSRFGFEPPPGAIVEDEAPDPPDIPVSRPGDLWQLGRHRLLCGDSTRPECMDKLMGGGAADLVLTDPPYNVDYEGATKDKLRIQNDRMADQAFLAFLSQAFTLMHRYSRSGAPIYVFHADSEGYNFRTAFRQAGYILRQCLVWVKDSMVMGRQDYQWQHEPILYGWKEGTAHAWYGGRKQTTIIEHDRPLRSAEHPTMKPVGLCAYLIRNSSREGDVVLDSFGGSGSTLIACEHTGRTCYTMELDPRYCDVIIGRWEALSNEKAVLLNEGSQAVSI